MSLTLCVLLWAHDGQAEALVAYEDRVLALLPDHGGVVLQRARTAGTGDEPLEVQLLRLESPAALDGYLADPRRTALSGDRDRAIARTQILTVDLV
jgi:hypothetical protein